MIRIAISYSKFATSQSGGARESLLTLLDGISMAKDIAVDVYQTPPADDPPETGFEYKIHTKNVYEVPKLTWTNQIVTRQQWGRYLRQQLEPQHDLLITQNKLAPVSVQVADELNISSLFFLRSMAVTGYEKYNPDRNHTSNIFQSDIGGGIQYPFLWKNFHDYRRAADMATHTIANSEFTATKINDLFGVEAAMIYPPIKLDNYKVEYVPDGHITMVNPRAEYKGTNIFLDIADRLSDEEFFLVGPISSDSIRRRADRMHNVTHWSWCDDMRDAYNKSKLVVVPSRVQEAFGRVPAEAMVSGIPCVVSSRGGLPEVVGETGLVVSEIESTEQWIDAIRTALSNHDPEAQQQRVTRFSAESQVEKLINIINSIIHSK